MTKHWKPIDTSKIIRSKPLHWLYRFVQPIVEKLLGFGELEKIYQKVQTDDPEQFATEVIKELEVTLDCPDSLNQLLKEIEGPVLIAANHPYGCIDAMAFMQLMAAARPKAWKIVANSVLHSVPQLADTVIPVDPFAEGDAKAANFHSLKQAIRYLKKGNLLGIFPAGRVAGRHTAPYDRTEVRDFPWSPHLLRIAQASGASILVIHFSGQNSDTFLDIPPSQLTRRTMRLAKEVPLQRRKHLTISQGPLFTPQEISKLSRHENAAAIFHAACYAAAEIRPAATTINTEAGNAAPSTDVGAGIEATPAALDELAKLEASQETEQTALYLFQGKDAPALLQVIGAAREVTFSAIGAGSGNTVDLSVEDDYYHHLLLWDKAQQRLIGAYRIGFIQEIIEQQGVEGIYLNHIFDIQPAFYQRIGNAMELSRSFILPQYQKEPQMLDGLWKGLGIAANLRNCNTLFGSVTISAEFSPLSQATLVDTLDRYHSDSPEIRNLVRSKQPFVAATQHHDLTADAWQAHGLNRLNATIEHFEHQQRPIPPLMRYYTTLGAKFLAFHIEPSFKNAIYCLLRVELDKLPARYKKRFLG